MPSIGTFFAAVDATPASPSPHNMPAPTSAFVSLGVASNGQELCTHEDALTQVAHCGPCRFGQSEISFSTACHGQFRTDPYAYSPYHVGN